MQKLNLYTAIGKGRPVSGLIAPRTSTARLHTCSCLHAADESSGDNPDIRRAPSRADRMKTASSEVRYLYESSGARSSNRATAPSSLKDALRQRAAQRVTQVDVPTVRRSGPGAAARPPPKEHFRRLDLSKRPARPGGSAASKSDNRPARRKRGPKSAGAGASKDNEFVGHEYKETYPDHKNVALLEKVVKIQNERAEKNLPVPTQYSELSEEEQDLTEVMKTREVKPDSSTILEPARGVHNEILGSGLDAQQHVDRLVAMAERKSQRKWAGLHVEEQEDVNALAGAFKSLGGVDKGNIHDHEAMKAIHAKWQEGQYQPLRQDASETINSALRGVFVNKSYTTTDGSAFMNQLKKIVMTSDPEPKGKVKEAVEAGAREAAMSKAKRESGSKVL